MTSLAAELVTPGELLAMDDAVAYELVAGRLVERNASTDASETILIVGYWLQAYIRTNPLGVFMAPDQASRSSPTRAPFESQTLPSCVKPTGPESPSVT